MPVAGGPNIVTDGLILALDGADKNSYPGSGTTWDDLTEEGNNGTLLNGATFDSDNQGSILFDGSNDYVEVPYTSDFAIGTGDFTYSSWVKSTNAGPYLRLFTIGVFNTSGNFQIERPNSTGLTVHINNNYPKSSASNPDGIWVNWAVTRISGTVTVYKNGTSIDSYTQTGAITRTDNIQIGRDSQYGVYWKGNIATTHFYNKSLSASEVTQNYLALKNRFGL